MLIFFFFKPFDPVSVLGLQLHWDFAPDLLSDLWYIGFRGAAYRAPRGSETAHKDATVPLRIPTLQCQLFFSLGGGPPTKPEQHARSQSVWKTRCSRGSALWSGADVGVGCGREVGVCTMRISGSGVVLVASGLCVVVFWWRRYFLSGIWHSRQLRV